MSNLKNKVDALPLSSGVYFFKDGEGKIIYIGKAKSLRKRVKSYFNRPVDGKTQVLVSKIKDLEYMSTPTDSQAQILEARLIKEKQPHYNIDLKDDKSFPWVRISAERFPQISVCRRKKIDKKDKSIYLGPYTSAQLLRKALVMVRKIFGFRSCRRMPKTACLDYRLKLCPGPCIGVISSAGYNEVIDNIKMFLDSRFEELLSRLYRNMNEAAIKQQFEEAAGIRDQINALSAVRRNAPAVYPRDELEDLKQLLKLNRLPRRIETFDISNISGCEATGSMVSFFNGIPDKGNYRRFKIKTVLRINDYAMIREVVGRRYSRMDRENLKLPDLVIIDGGKSHLLAALDEIRKIGISLNLISIAKDKENIYIKGKKDPVRLDRDTPGLNLIRRARDEAHRFALKYHHLLHKKKILGK
ncbi:MAG: excinuclease ABC subunit UvrC [Candidatus Omnitrophota bacterium]|nr:excinuclease ABC subunit UvrC [Candidatus Omnitrophota bacterium]MBU1928247.1 excinuclease ABC subunit UvrC [Candidatus Omnitrophota bacterium]MBU2034415.1 excinuclease ABC subunit UvrC [Candidatus Omnitrophota bacterium]MBU2221636.1 excinuclease ABC subunit UvrC [Candidatus Omnitrophota bacterium]